MQQKSAHSSINTEKNTIRTSGTYSLRIHSRSTKLQVSAIVLLFDVHNQLSYLLLHMLGIPVPGQDDKWSCGYQTLYARHQFMKLMEVKGNITHGDVVNMSFFSQEHFSYDANDAIMLVRSDLLYLTSFGRPKSQRQQRNAASFKRIGSACFIESWVSCALK